MNIVKTLANRMLQGRLARQAYVDSAAKFGLRYFIQHEMPPSFDYHKYDGKYSPYFLKWGIKAPLAPIVFFSQASGIDSDRFVEHGFAYRYLYPYLDRYQYIPAYHDKRIQAHMVHLDDPQRRFSALPCETVVANVNGIYYDVDSQEIGFSKACDILVSYKYPLVVKPSTSLGGGVGFMKVSVGHGRQYFEDLLTQCGRNFLVQRCVEQHPLMASFNSSSVNTIRIVTCRIPGGVRKILYAVVRYGAPGSNCDNALAGGGFTKINNDGTLANRLIYHEKQYPKDHLAESVTDVIPNYEAIKDAVLGMHAYLPWFNRVGWDIAIGTDGVPILIEFNIRSSVAFQQAVGPAYADADLDLLMERIVNFKVRYSPEPKLTYPDILGVDTWMCSSF